LEQDEIHAIPIVVAHTGDDFESASGKQRVLPGQSRLVRQLGDDEAITTSGHLIDGRFTQVPPVSVERRASGRADEMDSTGPNRASDLTEQHEPDELPVTFADDCS